MMAVLSSRIRFSLRGFLTLSPGFVLLFPHGFFSRYTLPSLSFNIVLLFSHGFFSRYTLPPLSFGFVLLFSHGVLFPLHAPQLLLPRDGLGPPRAEALSRIALLDDEACPNLHRNSTICGLMCLNDRGSCANMIEVLNIPPLESHLTSNIPLQACTRALARVSKQIYP